MENILCKYYKKTAFPTVFEDAIVLNLHVKLSIFEEETWIDTSAKGYYNKC